MSFSDFFQQNIVLFLFAFGIFIFLIGLEIKNHKQTEIITSAMLSRISNDGGLIIDLRKPEDYKKGHIAGAKNIPLADLENKISSLGKNKEKNIVLYCYKGKGSATALTVLKKNDYTNVLHLGGGIQTWENDNMPTVKS